MTDVSLLHRRKLSHRFINVYYVKKKEIKKRERGKDKGRKERRKLVLFY